MMIAEESTAWPGVSKPVYLGGLGFGFKWNMGWMNDTLEYMALDPIYRQYHHNEITFSMVYAFSENYVLPLSHDEVVHGKGSLIGKMHGDLWQRFANLRLLYAYMWAQPGKKLLFQGGELAQFREWAHDSSLDWHLLDGDPRHGQLIALLAELNRLYRQQAALHQHDVGLEGFQWVDANDAENSVYSFMRRGRDERDQLLAVFNCTPVPRHHYRVGVPVDGRWTEILNTDARELGGSGMGNQGGVNAEPVRWHDRRASLVLTLPPLGALYFVPEREP
jgi:1,4-alpha-glucan branching enzyme